MRDMPTLTEEDLPLVHAVEVLKGRLPDNEEAWEPILESVEKFILSQTQKGIPADEIPLIIAKVRLCEKEKLFGPAMAQDLSVGAYRFAERLFIGALMRLQMKKELS